MTTEIRRGPNQILLSFGPDFEPQGQAIYIAEIPYVDGEPRPELGRVLPPTDIDLADERITGFSAALVQAKELEVAQKTLQIQELRDDLVHANERASQAELALQQARAEVLALTGQNRVLDQRCADLSEQVAALTPAPVVPDESAEPVNA